MKTAIIPNVQTDSDDARNRPTLVPGPLQGARKAVDDRLLDPTQGTKIGSEPYDDPTQGRKVGSEPYDDPTRGR